MQCATHGHRSSEGELLRRGGSEREIDGGPGFADAAFDVRDCDDFRAA
jgi:hypothetical protein